LSIFTADAGMLLITSVVLTVLVPRRLHVVVPVGIVTGPNAPRMAPTAATERGRGDA
jgi:hypothetical protein